MKDVHRSCANTAPFYKRGLSIHGFLYLQVGSDTNPCGYWGMTIFLESERVLILII